MMPMSSHQNLYNGTGSEKKWFKQLIDHISGFNRILDDDEWAFDPPENMGSYPNYPTRGLM